MKRVTFIVSFLFIAFSIQSTLLAVPADKMITWESNGQGRVIFEGAEHAEKDLKCDTCHPSLFQMKKGSTKITLVDHVNGKYCGSCHNGETAFATDNPQKCNECHEDGEQHHKKRAKRKHHD